MTETHRGLEYTATASATDPDAVQLSAKVKSGLITEASFAFRVVDQVWNADRTEREIRAVDLNRGDVSICTYGANPNTSATARSLARRLGRPNRHDLDYFRARAHVLSLKGK